MKRLTLLRHAQADNPLPNQQDWERPLTKRGQLDATEMARRLKEQKLKPELVLCSPSLRTRQTAEAVSKAFTRCKVQFIEELYLASPKQMLATIQEHGSTARHVLVVAHNPGISELADELSQERRIEAMPTGALVTAEYELSDWLELLPASGVNVEFDYPQRPA